MATTTITVETTGSIRSPRGASNRRHITASKDPHWSPVHITIPAGPRTNRTVTLSIDLPDLIHIARELQRGLP